jgi:hypothetical protein
MSKILNIFIVLAVSFFSGILCLGCAAKAPITTDTYKVGGTVDTNKVQPVTTAPTIVPYIPPAYYACTQVDINLLETEYFAHYGNLYQAEQAYDSQIFVFKNIPVSASMLVDADTFDWGSAEFVALQNGAVGQLTVGESIDIVGVDNGPMPEVQGEPLASWFNPDGSPVVAIVPGWLYFTGCVFLPTGSVQLPAPGGPAFSSLY